MKKINIKEKANFDKLTNKLKSNNISLRYVFLDFALIGIIIVISYNVFLAYNRGVQNQEKLRQEETKLIKLQQENATLNEQENYYRSIEYRKAYAKESLNLTGEGERLFYVVRDNEELTGEGSSTLFNYDSIDNLDYWRLLILQR